MRMTGSSCSTTATPTARRESASLCGTHRVVTSASMIPFNRPHLTGREFEYIETAVRSGQLSGNGAFTKACQTHLQRQLGAHRVFLTHSCTGALEMAALLLDLQPGDEIMLPASRLVSTAH